MTLFGRMFTDQYLLSLADALQREHVALGAVLGPAADGGYYLIGLTQYHPNAFRNIPWSSTQTLAATLAALHLLKWNVAELPVLHDIDTQADWELWLQSSTHLSKSDQSGFFYDVDL